MNSDGLLRSVLDWIRKWLDMLAPVRPPKPVAQEVRPDR